MRAAGQRRHGYQICVLGVSPKAILLRLEGDQAVLAIQHPNARTEQALLRFHWRAVRETLHSDVMQNRFAGSLPIGVQHVILHLDGLRILLHRLAVFRVSSFAAAPFHLSAAVTCPIPGRPNGKPPCATQSLRPWFVCLPHAAEAVHQPIQALEADKAPQRRRRRRQKLPAFLLKRRLASQNPASLRSRVRE